MGHCFEEQKQRAVKHTIRLLELFCFIGPFSLVDIPVHHLVVVLDSNGVQVLLQARSCIWPANCGTLAVDFEHQVAWTTVRHCFALLVCGAGGDTPELTQEVSHLLSGNACVVLCIASMSMLLRAGGMCAVNL